MNPPFIRFYEPFVNRAQIIHFLLDKRDMF